MGADDDLTKPFEMLELLEALSGKVASVEYYGQGSSSNSCEAKNADIMMRVKSENGKQAQLSFFRYDQEFLGVDYDCWVKEVTEAPTQAWAIPHSNLLKPRSLI